jgi:alkanesulfonate monooxygenase SsuD/methylene tetrahydromethanopterin reductase-like flavin-dependent oxidoreductase (luciferase family)
VQRLSDDAELVKFCRLDTVQYEGDWDPEGYDPAGARASLEDHLDEAVEAERLGWDGYFLTEHHFDGWTLVPQPNVFLAALAMRTSRIRLGHAVQVLPVHHPFFLAEQHGMVDVLSGGRLEVGLGRGNFEFEWDRYQEDHADAEALYEDNLMLLKKSLTATRFTHQGVHAVAQSSTVYPRPLQDPVPIWEAASSLPSVERVARRGHNLLSLGVPDDRQRLETYSAAAAEAGYDVSGANMAVATRVICAPTDDEAERINERNAQAMNQGLAARGIAGDDHAGAADFEHVGSPTKVLEGLAELIKGSGARRLLLIVRLMGISGAESRQTQRLLAEQVFPSLRHLETGADVALRRG